MGERASRDTRRRLTIDQAADHLGITVDAVRGRIKRSTIAHEREAGRVYVLLDADQPRPGHDQDADQGGERHPAPPEDRTAELIATLKEQLKAEREAHAEARQAHAESRRLLAAALERIPAIEAPQEGESRVYREARESPETAREGAERASGRPDAASPQTPASPRPWWSRFFSRE